MATTTNPPVRLCVDVVYALPDRYWSVRVEVPAGAKLAQALAAARMETVVPGWVLDEGLLAIFSRPAMLATPLHDGDRIELLRPLQVDPKQSRRDRAGVRRPGKN